jgi:hypothetical protein
VIPSTLVATRRDVWRPSEIAAAVEAYLLMLRMQRLCLAPDKARIRRKFREDRLKGRSDASFEKRMCNISAVLADLGVTYLRGYKPLHNVGVNVRRTILRELVRQLV